jgi:hypothetical protein
VSVCVGSPHLGLKLGGGGHIAKGAVHVALAFMGLAPPEERLDSMALCEGAAKRDGPTEGEQMPLQRGLNGRLP